MKKEVLESDIVFTPEHIAIDMINYFKPIRSVLDPCRNSENGVFFKNLTSNAILDLDWYEILEGKDFFECKKEYDWIIGNPPYGRFSDFLRQSMKCGINICYLIPSNKVFNSYRMIKEISEWGGIVHMRHYGPGSKLKFPIGFAISAVWIQKNYIGRTGYSFYEWPVDTPEPQV